MYHPTHALMRIVLITIVVALLLAIPTTMAADGSLAMEGDIAAEGSVDADAQIPPESEAAAHQVTQTTAEAEATTESVIETQPLDVVHSTQHTLDGSLSSAPQVDAAGDSDLSLFGEEMNEGEAATAGAVAAIGMATGAGALFFLKNGIGLALSRFLGAPLFSRLKNDELLENEGRETLFSLVTNNPGIGLQQLADDSGLGWGTTVYHLGRLEQGGLITSMKNGQGRHFFKNGHPAAKNKKAIAVLKNDTAAQVARFLLATPGATGKSIAKGLGIAPPTVTKYVKRLEAEGLVETLKEGRSKIVQPTTPLVEAMGHIDHTELPTLPAAPSTPTQGLSAYA